MAQVLDRIKLFLGDRIAGRDMVRGEMKALEKEIKPEEKIIKEIVSVADEVKSLEADQHAADSSTDEWVARDMKLRSLRARLRDLEQRRAQFTAKKAKLDALQRSLKDPGLRNEDFRDEQFISDREIFYSQMRTTDSAREFSRCVQEVATLRSIREQSRNELMSGYTRHDSPPADPGPTAQERKLEAEAARWQLEVAAADVAHAAAMERRNTIREKIASE